jgi:integrase
MVSRGKELATLPGQETGRGEELWLRITAFLSARSPNTQDTYRGVISEWCQFLKGAVGTAAGAQAILGATDLDATRYREWLFSRPGERPRYAAAAASSSRNTKKADGLHTTLTNSTVSKKLAILRRLYRMLVASGAVANGNPFDSDRLPPPARESGMKRPTEMIPFELVTSILSAPNTGTAKGLRDKALLAVLFGGALRRSEAANLRLGDVRTSRAGTTYLYLRATKAKQDAEQALPRWAAEPVLALVKDRLSRGAGSGDFLFVGFTGKAGKTATTTPVSASGIYRTFKQHCESAGAGPYVTPHSARATAITRLLESGIAHREVQQFSRHASIQMVELYDKRRVGVEKNPGKNLEYD